MASMRPVRSTAVRTSRSTSAALRGVRAHERPATAALGDQVDRGAATLAWILAHVADDDVGALGGEAQRHRAAETRGRSR